MGHSQYRFFIVFCLCISLSACSSEKSSEQSEIASVPQHAVHKNFIADFEIAEKILPIQEIDLVTPRPGQLGEGWSHPEMESGDRWAEGLESTVFFKSLGNADMGMTLVCAPFAPDAESRQIIKIHLNGHDAGEIVLKTGENNYLARLPGAFLNKEGNNRLTFAYAYAKRPSDYPGSSDSRPLAVKFKQIRLAQTGIKPGGFMLIKKDGKIVQSPNTRMNFYYQTPVDSHLSVKIDHLQTGALAKLTLAPAKGNQVEIQMDEAGVQQIPLGAFGGKVVEFSFETEAGPQSQSPSPAVDDGLVSWAEIAIVQKEDRRGSGDAAALAKFKGQVKDLDVIYIIFDAFNADHSSLYGYPRKTTPFLDSLGKTGIVLDHFYANHPYTLASTGTLLTSKYSYEHGLIDKTNRLNPIFPTLPEILADQGIPSFLITGHGFLNGPWGLNRGFERVFFDDFKIHKVRIEKITEALAEIYDPEFRDKKKFIYLHLIPPHEPYTPPDQFRIFNEPQYQPISTAPETLLKIQNREIIISENQLEYIKAMYDANVLYADHIAEKILDFLKVRKITEKSIIMITSDHGEAFMEHGFTTHNSTIYDEMMHVPFIISLPDRLHLTPDRIAPIASVVDIAPTIMDIFGLDQNAGFNGKSLLSKLFGATNNEPVYMETLLTGQVGLRDLDYQLISKQGARELYNLRQDPLETDNRFDKEPIIAGFYLQYLNLYNPLGNHDAASHQVDIDALDQKTRDQLKELGYIQ